MEGLVTLRQLALGRGPAGLRLGDECRPAGLILGFGLAVPLYEARLDQHVVEDPGEPDAQGLLDIAGVENDLKVGPQPLEIVPTQLGGGLVFQQVVLVADSDDAIDLPRQGEAAG